LILIRVVFGNSGRYADARRCCTVPLLAVIGCYPGGVGWLNIIVFMIGLLLGQFSIFNIYDYDDQARDRYYYIILLYGYSGYGIAMVG
jgi:hypothetical protein